VVADVIRRYKRMRGYDVVMTTGTDEHGVNVERAAKKAGIPESEFVAKMADAWRALWDELGIPATNSSHHRSQTTSAPSNGSSSSAEKTATSTKATTPASTASTTTRS